MTIQMNDIGGITPCSKKGANPNNGLRVAFTKMIFEQERLLIDPRHPEVFYYDYAPPSPQPSN